LGAPAGRLNLKTTLGIDSSLQAVHSTAEGCSIIIGTHSPSGSDS